MFNGYNDTPLISYNEFDQPREKKQENVPKWSYGHATGVQSHAEFWSAKPNFLGITTPINPSSKCNCSGCYSENSSYQGDSTRHRPWLPRRFPVPLNGSSESCKLQGNHQWDNIGFSNQESCLIGSNVLTPQFLQENGGKRSYYRHYQNTRLPDLHQHGVITSIKTSSSSEGHVLLNQKNEISPNSTGQEMAFFGQNGARQTVFCNPPYDLTRNLEKRLDNRNSDPNFSDLNEKYSNLETYRHASGITQYPVEHHFSRSPVVEPYMKAVPLNLNQNRVPSTGHRNYKENITQSYIEQSIMRPNNNGPRKMIGSEVRQPVSGEKNGRVIFQSGVMKDGTVSENFQSGQLHSLPSPVSAGMDKKNNEILIDYAHFNMNRDLSKHYENITEMETQKKILFDCERHVDYFSRNSMPDTIKRSGQTILQDNKKDCALNQAGQTNYSEQQFNNCSKLNQGSNVPKYLEMNNSKPSVAVFYPKEFSADKISKPEKCGDHIQENPGFTQRNENFLKNENLSVRACLTRPPLIFNDPRDLRFVDKAQNSFPYQNNSCRNFVRPEYPCQSYSVPNSYDHSHSFSTNGFQRNNPSDINHRNLPQKISNCSSADLPYVSSANSTFICDPYCEQSGNLNKTLPQQFYTGTEQVSTNAVEMYSHVPQCRSEKLGPENSSELKKSSYLETISSQDISKNGNTKISPLRLLRKKKFVNQQSEIISKSPVPTNNSEVTPTLDVRKFWSTWADEEEDNTPPTQMVVLDCQNIDPEQAKLLHLYENDPANSDIHLENGGLLAVKDSGCADKDLITSSNHYGVNINEVKLNPEQIGLANKINRNDHIDSKVSTNANQFKAVQRIETVESGTLEEKKLQVSPLNALVEIINKNEKTEPANVKTEIVETGNLEKLNEAHYAQNISKDFNKANMFEESKEIASDKIEAGKKTELGESEKWADKKINIAKDGEQREATKIPRSEGTEIIHKTRPSFQTENVSNGKAKKNNSKNLEKATVTKPKLTQLENEANCDDTSNSLSPFDYSSQSASPYNAKIDFPTLPTSEYRRNKFLDYSDKRVIVNGNLAFSLEADNVIKARENDDLPEKVVESAVSLKNDSLPVSEVEEIKEKNIKQECPYKNSRSLLDKCLTSELSKSKHELFKSESVINDFESKEETGLQNFEIDDILQKMSNINFQCSEHKIENGFANHVNTDHVKAAKTPSALKKIKKSKKLEHRQGADRTDKPLIENISEPKPMMKFSIQKSDDLKISFKVLNDGSICKKEKFESNDEEFRTRTTENGRIPVTEPKNETVSKTLKIKSAHNNDWTYIKTNSDDVLHRSEKEVLRKKNKRRFRRKKIKESKFLQKKTPLLKIKKSRYLVPEEKKFLSESASYKKDLNLLEEQTDVYFASTDFQVRESVNSAKIKLTFKRQKSNFENEYKISDYGIENAKENNIESDDQLDFNNADYQSEGDESRSSRKKHRRSLNENSLSDLGKKNYN